MSENTIEGTEKNFETELQGTSALVDFWAPWCGPCRAVGPVVDQLAQEYQGKVKVLKVNVDDHQALAVRFGVMSIPTLVFFKDGKEMDKIVGAQSKEAIQAKMDALLN
jgi:thioredoxin 1